MDAIERATVQHFHRHRLAAHGAGTPEALGWRHADSQRLRLAIRTALSARHVPSDIYQVESIPRTLSGKKLELPVKKLLLGADPAKVLNRDAMANAASVDWFVAFAQERQAR